MAKRSPFITQDRDTMESLFGRAVSSRFGKPQFSGFRELMISFVVNSWGKVGTLVLTLDTQSS